MRIQITVELDGSDSEGFDLLEELEIAAAEGESVAIRTAAGPLPNVEIIDVKQVPAGPRST